MRAGDPLRDLWCAECGTEDGPFVVSDETEVCLSCHKIITGDAHCPVCGSDDIGEHPEPGYLACGGCLETLAGWELVTERTNATRLAYARNNGHPDDYEERYDTEESNA